MASSRRLQKELAELHNSPITDVTIELEEDNIYKWACKIKGPPNSPYKGGNFKLSINFPNDYPFKPPNVKFLTKVYHPGINEEGAICIPILKDEWKPGVTMSKVITTIYEKLGNPSADDPFEPHIAAELKNNNAKFLANAKDWTKKYAS